MIVISFHNQQRIYRNPIFLGFFGKNSKNQPVFSQKSVKSIFFFLTLTLLKVQTVAKRHMRFPMFTASYSIFYSGFMCQTTVIFVLE